MFGLAKKVMVEYVTILMKMGLNTWSQIFKLQLTLSFRLIWMFYCFYFLSSTSKKQCIASSSFPKALQYFYQKKLFRPRFVNPSCMPSLLILPQNIKWTHSKNTIFYYMAVATNYFTMITK